MCLSEKLQVEVIVVTTKKFLKELQEKIAQC